MALYHFSAKVISRKTGRSAVGASAYRSGENLTNEYDGLTHDYTRKGGIAYTEIMLPDNAPPAYQDRETLWNAVEQSEKSGTARLAREVEVSLPVELNREEQIRLVQDFVKENFTDKGMCADIAMHDKDGTNPHAHIMLTVRPMDENGQWENKYEKEYLCKNAQGEERGFTGKELAVQPDGEWEKQMPYYKNGNAKGKPMYMTQTEAANKPEYERVSGKKQPLCNGLGRENPTAKEWNSHDTLEHWRVSWADHTNRELENKGVPERVDHRTLEAQGITSRLPTIHVGPTATAMEIKGKKTDRGNINREVMNVNREIEHLERTAAAMRREMDAMREQAAADRAEREKLERERANQQAPQQGGLDPHQGDARPGMEPPPLEVHTERDKAPLDSRAQQFNEDETRSWQRGDGLMREDTTSARETALAGEERKDKPADTAPQHEAPATPPQAAQPTAQEMAEQLNKLDVQAQRQEIEIRQLAEQQRIAAADRRQLEAAEEKMAESKNRVNHCDKRLDELKQQRDQASGMFKGKERAALDKQIESVQQSRQQAVKTYNGSKAERDQLKAQQPKQADVDEKVKALTQQQAQTQAQFKALAEQVQQRADSAEIRQKYEAGHKQDPQYESIRDNLTAGRAHEKMAAELKEHNRSMNKDMERPTGPER